MVLACSCRASYRMLMGVITQHLLSWLDPDWHHLNTYGHRSSGLGICLGQLGGRGEINLSCNEHFPHRLALFSVGIRFSAVVMKI